MGDDWLLYGATGYTGELIAQAAVARGHRPTLAGRSEQKLRAQAERLGLSWTCVGLDEPALLRRTLEGQRAVLHAAGPYLVTADAVVRACLDVGVHYLDITGETPVFQQIFARHDEAKKRSVSLVSGVGFDVVASDCLVAQVAARCPSALELEVAIGALSRVSPGTAKSALGMVPLGGKVRRDGKLVSWPLGKGARRVPLRPKERWAVPLPLAELETAWRTTRIPNITTYLAVSSRLSRQVSAAWPALSLVLPAARWAMSSEKLLTAADQWLTRRVHGPTEEDRQVGQSFLWALARGPSGSVAQGWLSTIEAYAFTAQSAVLAVERVLRDRPVGAMTPSQAFGSSFALEIEGTRLELE